MKQFKLTFRSITGSYLKTDTIKAQSIEDAEKYAKIAKKLYTPLTEWQKEVSKAGVNVFVG